MAMNALAGCGADIFLSGHLHASNTGHSSERYNIPGHSALIVQAGTALSTRGRGENNSFNIIRIERPSVVVRRFEWDKVACSFNEALSERFIKYGGEWRAE
jgi:hypothetical protein